MSKMKNEGDALELKRGEALPPDLELSEAVLKKMGVASKKLTSVLETLARNGVETGGHLNAMRTEEEMRAKAGGDEMNGRALWVFLHPAIPSVSVAAPAAKQAKLSDEPVPFERIEYSTDSKYLELPQTLVSKAGLAAPSTDKRLLFCRAAIHQQFAFLKQTVLDEGHTGYIYGPPGTGKSNTTLAFCLSNETQGCVVTWIHLNREGEALDCFQIKENTLLQIEDLSSETLAGFLSSVTSKHLVILDGYASSEMLHVPLKNKCLDWFKKKKESRCLVIVSSMSSGAKVRDEEMEKLRWQEHCICSWEFAEYEEAAEDNDFFNSVKQYLDADSSLLEADAAQLTGEQKTSLLSAKYHFAGGSSRFMFSYSTKQVMEKLDKGLNLVTDISQYVNGTMGDQSSQAVNRLLGRLPHPSEQFQFRTVFISRYASLLFAQKMGPELVLTYAANLASLNNPSLMGWIFEMLFFSVLRHRDVHLVDAKKEKDVWRKAEPKRFDPLSFDFTQEATRNKVWYQPQAWNQGAYDAVYIEPLEDGGYLVRFVQVASGDTHDLRLDIIHAFMNHCKRYFETKELEIIFVVPNTQKKLDEFQIRNVTGSGLLSAFQGWMKGKEIEQCRILSLVEKWEY